SLILMPETLVSISLKMPPLSVPGLRSNVSIWLGPPFIHRRMHERLRFGFFAASSAKAGSHPDSEPPRTPAAANLRYSRREREIAIVDLLDQFSLLAARRESAPGRKQRVGFNG